MIRRRKIHTAFTLVELLVVIAIISVLAALLLPALEGALASAYQVSCMSNLKQVGLIANFYADDNEESYPYRTNRLSYFPAHAYYNAFRQLEPYDFGEQNRFCPGAPSKQHRTYPAYGDYIWTAGYISHNWTLTEKMGACDMQRKDLVVPERWALMIDVLQPYDATVHFAYPPAPDATGYQNPDSASSRLNTNHELGMNVLCAGGNVKWYTRELTSLSVTELKQFQMLYPVELPYHSLYALGNTTVSYYFQNKDGTPKDVISKLDNVLIAKNWGFDN